jgi:hypothetical protein
VRPNQRNGFPTRACRPEASAPAAIGRAGVIVTIDSISGSGCAERSTPVILGTGPSGVSGTTGVVGASAGPLGAGAARSGAKSIGGTKSSSDSTVTPSGAARFSRLAAGARARPAPSASYSSSLKPGSTRPPVPARAIVDVAGGKVAAIRRLIRRSWIQL